MTDESEILEGLRKRLLVERLHQMAIAALLPITTEDLSNAATEFETFEKRGGFYDMARALLVSGWELEGCILLLATWNIARFKFFASNFDIEALRKALADLSGDFASLKECTIQDIDLQANGPCVESMFNRLAEIKGVKFTGAPKLMHLKVPELFVPWDDYIRGGNDKRFYSDLQCVRSQKWCLLEYERNGEGYVRFLSDVQNRVRDLQYPEGQKTLAKSIDEWHYVSITLPIQALEKKEKEESKKKRPKGA